MGKAKFNIVMGAVFASAVGALYCANQPDGPSAELRADWENTFFSASHFPARLPLTMNFENLEQGQLRSFEETLSATAKRHGFELCEQSAWKESGLDRLNGAATETASRMIEQTGDESKVRLVAVGLLEGETEYFAEPVTNGDAQEYSNINRLPGKGFVYGKPCPQ